MKKCKFCNAELPDGSTVCPSCGKDNAAESGSKAAKPGSAALIIVGVLALVILAIGAFFTAKEGTTLEEAKEILRRLMGGHEE